MGCTKRSISDRTILGSFEDSSHPTEHDVTRRARGGGGRPSHLARQRLKGERGLLAQPQLAIGCQRQNLGSASKKNRDAQRFAVFLRHRSSTAASNLVDRRATEQPQICLVVKPILHSRSVTCPHSALRCPLVDAVRINLTVRGLRSHSVSHLLPLLPAVPKTPDILGQCHHQQHREIQPLHDSKHNNEPVRHVSRRMK